ncbi:hypothetical protein OKW76_00330 [Sphingomonas sp. S1-29]|uniref:hypothetical protein n=1 Tax=Sphingomonas sp. S1-29 TaxID=2991074 RepID=UPI00223F5CF7|nr:hypothetical protein [Sphingomonas sp. S1-29]UZK69571.1 hypothetical protein OKW76_00330 [Sphingomonas sp. S1-29]
MDKHPLEKFRPMADHHIALYDRMSKMSKLFDGGCIIGRPVDAMRLIYTLDHPIEFQWDDLHLRVILSDDDEIHFRLQCL